MKVDKSKELEELLVELQELTIRELLDRAKSGDITSAEIAQVVQICKLNEVNITITEAELDEDVKAGLKGIVENEKILPFAREA